MFWFISGMSSSIRPTPKAGNSTGYQPARYYSNSQLTTSTFAQSDTNTDHHGSLHPWDPDSDMDTQPNVTGWRSTLSSKHTERATRDYQRISASILVSSYALD